MWVAYCHPFQPVHQNEFICVPSVWENLIVGPGISLHTFLVNKKDYVKVWFLWMQQESNKKGKCLLPPIPVFYNTYYWKTLSEIPFRSPYNFFFFDYPLLFAAFLVVSLRHKYAAIIQSISHPNSVNRTSGSHYGMSSVLLHTIIHNSIILFCIPQKI